jgi:peroxiredoxin Q/BCP
LKIEPNRQSPIANRQSPIGNRQYIDVFGVLELLLRRPKMLKVGDPAPQFAVQDHTGVIRRLSDYRGKHVVLWFYPKADTPG